MNIVEIILGLNVKNNQGRLFVIRLCFVLLIIISKLL